MEIVVEDDPLYLASVDVMRERPEDAGICALQRGLLIGYNRASRLMDCMIERGIVVRTYRTRFGLLKVVRLDLTAIMYYRPQSAVEGA